MSERNKGENPSSIQKAEPKMGVADLANERGLGGFPHERLVQDRYEAESNTIRSY
jgi:hypothetical protein